MSQVKFSQRRRPAVRSSVRRQHHFASLPAQSCTTTGTPEIQPGSLDLCASVAGPTNGRHDRASGEDGFVLVFLFIEGFVLMLESLRGRRADQREASLRRTQTLPLREVLSVPGGRKPKPSPVGVHLDRQYPPWPNPRSQAHVVCETASLKAHFAGDSLPPAALIVRRRTIVRTWQ
jgi:hypothetical protein